VKLFYTGPVVNALMLVMMLEKHGITATQAFMDPAPPVRRSVRSEIFVARHAPKSPAPSGRHIPLLAELKKSPY